MRHRNNNYSVIDGGLNTDKFSQISKINKNGSYKLNDLNDL